MWPTNVTDRWTKTLLTKSNRERRPSSELYLKHFPSAVEVLKGAGVLHRQMDIGDRQLVGKIVDVLHALLHLGQLLLE